MKYHLKIEPAISPNQRICIEDTLIVLGYSIIGAGTKTDKSWSDISFEDKKEEV